MKYLSNRDEFLKRSLNKIEEYKSIEIDLEKLNETDNSGPFANDIPWGNSLIGRLINFGIRKARMGANLLRIKPVGKRLEETFKNLLDGSTTSTLSEENKKDQNRLTISKLLEELDKAVKESANVGEIKRLTNEAISNISKIEGLENKESLLSQLEEFKKFLEQFKDEEGGKETTDEDEEEGEGEGKEGEGEEKGENKEVGVEKGSKTSESVYPTMIKTLKSLALVISHYKEVKMAQVTKKETGQVNTKLKYITVAGDTVEKIQKNPKANLKKLTAADIRSKNTQVLVKYPKDNSTMPAGLVLLMESFMFEAIGEGGSPDRANIKGGEDHLTQAFTKLKKAIETLESPKDKGVGVDVKFLNEITSKSLDTKNKEIIKSLFTEVNRYLVGDKKATLNAATDPLYKESIEIISDKNKKIVVAEKIARFTKRALQFDGEGLYGGLGETGKNLQPFVEGMKSIMAIKPTEEKPAEETTKFKVGDVVKWKNKEGKEISKKIEKIKDGSYYFTSEKGEEYSKKEADLTKESVISKYSSFLSYIKEADEAEASSDKDTQASDPVRMTTSQKIIDYWSKKIDIKSFILERTEEKKIVANFEKITPSKDIVINGLDPIIEIVKLFNRAYKLHTTKVIPNVETSDGRVSASEYANYTPFGDGTRMTAGISGGPFRNNMIFNDWESKVQDIIKNTKYQPIFRSETVLKTKDGNIINDAGKYLLKFMNEMLDGEELYKSSKSYSGDKNMGKQAEFIQKYFGATEEEIKKAGLTFDPKTEPGEITGTSKDMPADANLKFKKDLIKMEKLDEMSGSFFACGTKDSEGKTKQIYFYVQSADATYAYVTYCESFYFFKRYIRESGQITTSDSYQGLEKQTKIDQSNEDGQYKIKATRIKLVDLINKDGKFILADKNFKIKYLTKYSSKVNAASQAPSTGTEEMVIQTCYTLCNIDKENKLTRYKLTKDISGSINTAGGFRNITRTEGILASSMERKS